MGYRIVLLDTDKEVFEILQSSNIIEKIDYINEDNEMEKLLKKEVYDIAIINPDLYTLNIDTLIKNFLARRIPTLIILGRYDDVEKTIEALSAGAFDYFQKPTMQVLAKEQKEKAAKDIALKIKLAIESKDKIKAIDLIRDTKIGNDEDFDFSNSSRKIIIIGSSTGGPQSLDQIIPFLPKEIPSTIIVVQHMPPVFTEKLAERLNSISNIPVKEAEDNEEIKEGVCYIAKGDYHLELKKNSRKRIIISLNKKEKILGVRPCINITMESASKIFKNNAIGVILTGMGSDGTVGCKKIKQNGGTVIVESEKTSIIYGMPKSAEKSGYYDAIVDLQKIPVAMLQMLEV